VPRSGLARAGGSGSSRGSRFDGGRAAGHRLGVVAIAHLDEVDRHPVEVGHLRATWSFPAQAAGAVRAGVAHLEIPAGGWSTPAHEHGAEEEIFYVLSGRGLSWQKGETSEIDEGDCILYAPRRGAHTLQATEDLDVLAFGPRLYDEAPRFPRLDASLLGNRLVASTGSTDGLPVQFTREAELGRPELPEPGPRPATIVNVRDVEEKETARPRIARTRRDLGRAIGSVTTGLKHIDVVPGKLSAPLHCHSLEEEIFVVLDGDGLLLLGDGELPVRKGSVVSRPAGTGVAHAFRAGDGGLTLLAYGTREPGDLCFYPTSSKVGIAGAWFRVEPLDYWDGED
jgi:uncharacterized cupin superfamily protein